MPVFITLARHTCHVHNALKLYQHIVKAKEGERLLLVKRLQIAFCDTVVITFDHNKHGGCIFGIYSAVPWDIVFRNDVVFKHSRVHTSSFLYSEPPGFLIFNRTRHLILVTTDYSFCGQPNYGNTTEYSFCGTSIVFFKVEMNMGGCFVY